jgi:hypothetical protein
MTAVAKLVALAARTHANGVKMADHGSDWQQCWPTFTLKLSGHGSTIADGYGRNFLLCKNRRAASESYRVWPGPNPSRSR